MKTCSQIFRRVLEKATEELLSSSDEHPSTRDLSVDKIDIVVHYKGSEVKTVCAPRILGGDPVVEAPVEESLRKTTWEFLLDDLY